MDLVSVWRHLVRQSDDAQNGVSAGRLPDHPGSDSLCKNVASTELPTQGYARATKTAEGSPTYPDIALRRQEEHAASV